MFAAIAGTASQVTQIAGGIELLATVVGWQWAFGAAAIVVAVLGTLVALRRPRMDADAAAERTTLRSLLAAALERAPARPTWADVRRRLGNALQRSLRPWPHPPAPASAPVPWRTLGRRVGAPAPRHVLDLLRDRRDHAHEPRAAAGGGRRRRQSSDGGAWILATAQLVPLGYVARLAKGSNRSPATGRGALCARPAAGGAVRPRGADPGLVARGTSAVDPGHARRDRVGREQQRVPRRAQAPRPARQLGSVLGQTFGNIGYAVGTFGAAMLTLAPSGWLAPSCSRVRCSPSAPRSGRSAGASTTTRRPRGAS